MRRAFLQSPLLHGFQTDSSKKLIQPTPAIQLVCPLTAAQSMQYSEIAKQSKEFDRQDIGQN